MQIFLNILIFTVCIMIFYQDFKDREVSWILFPLLFILVLSHTYIKHQSINFMKYNILINLLILIITGSCIVFYFSVKGKKINQIYNEMIGLGDILLLLAITPFFNPNFYCFFIVSGSIISLIGKIIFNFIKNEKSIHIPLAGNLAFLFSIILLITECQIIPDINNMYY